MKRICLGTIEEGREVATLSKLNMSQYDREMVKEIFGRIIDEQFDEVEGEDE